MPHSFRNLVSVADEVFRPPVFKPNTSLQNRMENWLRRFLDLQSGSGWRDMKRELATAQGTLLDIGCGAQVYRELVPHNVSYRGIDTMDAKQRFGYEIPDTHYFDGDDWGVPDGSIEIVLCTEVLEHIQAPAAFLRKIRDTLCLHGRLVMTVPFAARWHFIPHDFWRFTPSGIAALLTDTGFSDIVVTARGNPLTVACYKVMALPLMLIFGDATGWRRVARLLTGILLLPVVGAIAVVANISMRSDWGDDCLGYTVTAKRKT